jgi:hypothetical protein
MPNVFVQLQKKMASKQKVWNIYHHFCSLLEEKFDQLANPVFENVHITENDVAKNLFARFKKETVASKDWKGFPSKKGPRNKAKGIPETTKMDKDHKDIQNLFNSFFSKFENEIKENIDKTIEEWKESDDESDEVEQEKSESNSPPLNQQPPIVVKQECESGKEETNLTKRAADSDEESSKKRKLDKKESNPNISNKKDNNLTAEKIDVMTSELQEAIQADISIQDKNMTRSKVELSKIQSVVDRYLPEYEKKLTDLENHKQKVMKELEDELNHFKSNNMTIILDLKETMDQVSNFIPVKEKEFAEIAEKKREEKKSFFLSLAAKKSQPSSMESPEKFENNQ